MWDLAVFGAGRSRPALSIGISADAITAQLMQ